MQTFITWPSIFIIFSSFQFLLMYANTEKNFLYFWRKRKNLTIYHKVVKVFIPWFHFRTDAFFILFFQFRYNFFLLFSGSIVAHKKLKKRYQHKFFYIFKLKQMYLNWQYVILLYLLLFYIFRFSLELEYYYAYIFTVCVDIKIFFFVHFLSIIYIWCIDMDDWECLNYEFFFTFFILEECVPNAVLNCVDLRFVLVCK